MRREVERMARIRKDRTSLGAALISGLGLDRLPRHATIGVKYTGAGLSGDRQAIHGDFARAMNVLAPKPKNGAR